MSPSMTARMVCMTSGPKTDLTRYPLGPRLQDAEDRLDIGVDSEDQHRGERIGGLDLLGRLRLRS